MNSWKQVGSRICGVVPFQTLKRQTSRELHAQPTPPWGGTPDKCGAAVDGPVRHCKAWQG